MEMDVCSTHYAKPLLETKWLNHGITTFQCQMDVIIVVPNIYYSIFKMNVATIMYKGAIIISGQHL